VQSDDIELPGFTFRYAIRMPNGELYRHPQQQQHEQPTSGSDPWSWLGLRSPVPEPPPTPTGPVIFDNRQGAVQLLKEIRERAAAVGVTHWGGSVVAQLCTPFTPGDPAEDFWPALVAWLRAQGMDA